MAPPSSAPQNADGPLSATASQKAAAVQPGSASGSGGGDGANKQQSQGQGQKINGGVLAAFDGA